MSDKCNRCVIKHNILKLSEKIKECERDRDLAIAHDSQDYPTVFAYEQVCKTLHKKEEDLKELTEMLDDMSSAYMTSSWNKLYETVLKYKKKKNVRP